MPTKTQPADDRFSKSIVLLVLAIVLFVGARTHADPDLWGHVLFGRDILSEGIPQTDMYSYVSGDHPWINHELLAEVAFGAVFESMGVPGLVGLKVLLIFTILGLIYRRLCRQGLHPLRAGIVLMLVIMLMSVGLWTLRPHLFTYLFFLLTLLLMDQAERGNRKALWMLPVVMFLWANSHGGYLAGLGVLGVWCAAHVLLWLRPAAPPSESGRYGPRFMGARKHGEFQFVRYSMGGGRCIKICFS